MQTEKIEYTNDAGHQGKQKPTGEIAKAFLCHPTIRFELDRNKYKAILETFIAQSVWKNTTIIGGCFTKKPANTKFPRNHVDLYISLDHVKTDFDIHDADSWGRLLEEIKTILSGFLCFDDMYPNREYNRNSVVFCNVCRQEKVKWIDEKNQEHEETITIEVRFTTQDMNRIEALFDMFELEPCKIAFKNGKFYFSDFFLRGGSIIAEGHNPHDTLIERYLEKGFTRNMDIGWSEYCQNFNI